ncbi:hypothetical protein ACWCOT_41460 [Nonomuraea bangladeshensis]
MTPDPRPAAQGSAVRAAQDLFDTTYSTPLNLLEQAFDGDPRRLKDATRTMFTLRAQVQALMALPGGAGPPFAYVSREARS